MEFPTNRQICIQQGAIILTLDTVTGELYLFSIVQKGVFVSGTGSCDAKLLQADADPLAGR